MRDKDDCNITDCDRGSMVALAPRVESHTARNPARTISGSAKTYGGVGTSD
jgi:hypothetical protein